MAFPTNPSSGTAYFANGTSYIFNDVSNAWLKSNKIANLDIITDAQKANIIPSNGLIIKQSDAYYIYDNLQWKKLNMETISSGGIQDTLTSKNRTIILDAFNNISPIALYGNYVGVGINSVSSGSSVGYMTDNITHNSPTYNGTIPSLNGKPGFVFQNSQKHGIRVTNMPMSSSGLTIMMPMYILSYFLSYSSPWRLAYSDGSNESDIGQTYTSTTREQYDNMGGTSSPNYMTPRFDSFYISTMVITPTTTYVYRNKTLVGSFGITRANFTSYTNLFIGFGRWTSQFIGGYIGKTYIIYGTLTQSEINTQVDAYSTGYNYSFN